MVSVVPRILGPRLMVNFFGFLEDSLDVRFDCFHDEKVVCLCSSTERTWQERRYYYLVTSIVLPGKIIVVLEVRVIYSK